MDWVNQGLAANSALPADLQITSNVLPDEQRRRYEQGYLQQYVNPMLADIQSTLYGQGRANSSFGGAQLGAAQAQGAYQGMMAGETLYENRLNQLLARRASFYGNEVNQAQTSNLQNVQRGTNLAQMAQRSNESQNQFNLNAFNSNMQAQGQAFGQAMDMNRFAQQQRESWFDRSRQQQQDNLAMQKFNQGNQANAWRLGAGAASAAAPVVGQGIQWVYDRMRGGNVPTQGGGVQPQGGGGLKF